MDYKTLSEKLQQDLNIEKQKNIELYSQIQDILAVKNYTSIQSIHYQELYENIKTELLLEKEKNNELEKMFLANMIENMSEEEFDMELQQYIL